MTAKWWAFGLWAAVAATALYWGLKLFVPGTPVPPHTAVATMAASPRGDLTRLLGADPVATAAAVPAASSRFHLVGVVAPRSDFPSRDGVALIAVDGKPAKVYRVGAVVDGETVLKAVAQRGAQLGPREGAATVALDIPPPAPAATGALPSALAPAAPPPVPTVAPSLPVRLPQPGPANLAPPRLPAPLSPAEMQSSIERERDRERSPQLQQTQ